MPKVEAAQGLGLGVGTRKYVLGLDKRGRQRTPKGPCHIYIERDI